MLQIKNLTITHRKDLRIILDKFNVVLNDGDKAVIIGEEGNGKSTLMKWIYNPELALEYTECEGERIITGEVKNEICFMQSGRRRIFDRHFFEGVQQNYFRKERVRRK